MAPSASSSEPPPGVTRRRAASGGWSVQPRPQTYRSGEVIAAKYQLQQVIGKGGMGSVWLARNLVLHVDIAIKIVDRKFADGEAAQRLLVEARAAAKLGHASIVRIHDFGRTDCGDPYIVMELLNGESLEEVIDRKGCLPAVSAVRLLLPIVGALEAAHNKGIIHRDIKPPNIILVAEGADTVVPKLVDFGIAKVEREIIRNEGRGPDLEEASQLARRLTQTGTLIGSPEYMAPEQARGDDVDARTDIWALSVVLYEALTGTLPFDGETIDKLLLSILVDQPLPTTEIVEGDDRLWRIVERGLSKAKSDRWPDARALGEALAMWLLDQGADADMTGASLRQHWLGDRPSRSAAAPSASRLMDDLIDRDPLGVKDTSEHDLAIPLTVPQPVDDEPSAVAEPSTELPRKKTARRALGTGVASVLLLGAAVFGAWLVGLFMDSPPAAPAATAPVTDPARQPESTAPDAGTSHDDAGAGDDHAEPADVRRRPRRPSAQATPHRTPTIDTTDLAASPPDGAGASAAPSSAPNVPGAPSTGEPATPAPPAEQPAPTTPEATAAPPSGELPIPDLPNF